MEPSPEVELIRFHLSDEWQPLPAAATKASLAAVGELGAGSAFGVDAYLAGTATKYISAATASYRTETEDWRFTDDYYWPMSESLDFLAWMPADRANTCVAAPTRPAGAGPGFVCTSLPLTTAGQLTLQEFVYAWKTGQNKTSPGAAGVTLAFHHPFARISFQVTTAHQELHINTITFKGIKQTGTFQHNNPEGSPAVPPAWSGLSDPGNLVITVNSDIAAGAVFTAAQLASFGLPFLVIPQTYTATDQIEINLEWPKGSAAQTVTFTNPIAQWERGKSYTYSLDLSDTIRFGVTVEDWETGTVYGEIIFRLTAEGWVADTTNSLDLDFGE